MIVPLLETVLGFILSVPCAVASGSSLEIWMMAGNAIRMALDMGLHLEVRQPCDENPIEAASILGLPIGFSRGSAPERFDFRPHRSD